MHKGAELKHST